MKIRQWIPLGMKFSQVLNCVDDQTSKLEVLDKLSKMPNTVVPCVTLAEMKLIVKNLTNNKAVGLDSIPNEFYKYAPCNILTSVSMIFKSFQNHCYLPVSLMSVLIVPLSKGKLKDPSLCTIYRPIAIGTAAS